MPDRTIKSSVVRKFVLSSPWLPLIFIACFALCIYAEFARLPVPRFLPSLKSLIVFNNVCLMLVVALRFVVGSSRLSRKLRYDPGDLPRSDPYPSAVPLETVRTRLTGAGFFFDQSGYGEKRNLAPAATAAIYGGLLLALLAGSYDNMRQFSAVFFQGEGAPASLDDPGLYFNTNTGPLASVHGLPRLQVKKMSYATAKVPKNSVEIVLYDKKNHLLAQGTAVKDGKPLVYQGMEYHLGRFLADVPLLIATDNMHLEYEGTMKVQPLEPPQGSYSYYASIKGVRLLWDVLYDPTAKKIKLLGGKNGKNLIDGEYQFGRDTAVQLGSYVVKVPWLTDWSEIHVVRPRHMFLVYVGAVIAFLGILLRLFFQPQVVWLEETAQGCRVWAVGQEAKRLVKSV